MMPHHRESWARTVFWKADIILSVPVGKHQLWDKDTKPLFYPYRVAMGLFGIDHKGLYHQHLTYICILSSDNEVNNSISN